MILLLEVRSGPWAGKGIRVQPGQSVRVGRTGKSEFMVPADGHLSGVHFAVEVSDGECRVRDLNSRNGTLLNGQRVTDDVLHDGDVIVAGDTSFRITLVTAGEAPATEGPSDLGPEATAQQRLLSMLRTQYQPLYAILDAARDIRILALLMQSKEEHQSLYEGVQGEKLSQVAPYLVRLDKDSPLLGTLVLEGWGNSWGVYLTCDGAFQDVRRHLRRFLEVQLPDGKQVYFRYYDPRVLRVYLPTCTTDETNQIFGPIKYYLMEDEKPEKLLQFANTGRGTDKNPISLIPAVPVDTTTVAVEKILPTPHEAIPKRNS